jgi:hypothetical protein
MSALSTWVGLGLISVGVLGAVTYGVSVLIESAARRATKPRHPSAWRRT